MWGALYNRFKEEFGVMPNDWMNERTKEDMLQAAGIRNITNEGLGYVMKMTQSQLCHFMSWSSIVQPHQNEYNASQSPLSHRHCFASTAKFTEIQNPRTILVRG